jgi:hypothetical protein
MPVAARLFVIVAEPLARELALCSAGSIDGVVAFVRGVTG